MSAKDYAKRLDIEGRIASSSHCSDSDRAKLAAAQGQALRATIAAAAGEIVDAVRAVGGLQPFDGDS